MSKSCSRTWQAEAIVDGRLEGPDRSAFERHIATCSDCAKEMRSLERIHAIFTDLPESMTMPLEHRRNRMALLERASQRSPRPRVLRWVAAGAAIAACLVVVMLWRAKKAIPARSVTFDVVDVAGGRWSTIAMGEDARVQQSDGVIRVHVEHLAPSEHFLLQLPDGAIEVRGTRFVVGVNHGRTDSVEVIEGTVALRLLGAPERVLRAGESWSAPHAIAVAVASIAVDVNDLPAPPSVSLPARNVEHTIQHDAGSSRSTFDEGVDAFDAGDYGRADRLLAEFVRVNASDARAEDAEFMRVICHVRMSDKPGARSLAQTYLDGHPNGLRRAEALRLSNDP